MALVCALGAGAVFAQSCGPGRAVYLTFDTGNMSQAENIAATLQRHQVKATFFLANERTARGDHSLDDAWRPFWQARVQEGHAFGSHTYDHVYFRSVGAGDRWQVRPQFGVQAGKTLVWGPSDLCGEIGRVDERFRSLTGRGLDPLWRAPGGKAPGAALDAARQCGWTHVHWAAAGFLGDELPSESFPNATLLSRALATVRPGDILMAHLGIWSRRDPWAPMLDPLIEGLRKKGMCFATLADASTPLK